MLKIGTKLGIGIGILLTLCVVIGLVSYTQTRIVSQKIEEITEVKEPVNSAVYGLENNLFETGFATLGYQSLRDSSLLASSRRSAEQFPLIQEKFRKAVGRGQADKTVARLDDGFARLQAAAGELIRLRDEQGRSMAELLGDLDRLDELLKERIQGSVTAEDPVAYRRLQAVLEMEVNVNAITKGLGTFLLTGREEFESRIGKAEGNFRKYFTVYKYVVLTPQEEAWSAELKHRSDESLKISRLLIAQEKQRRQKLDDFLEISRGLSTLLNERIQLRTEKSLADAKADVLRAGERANTTIMVVLLLSVAFGIGAGVLTTKNITGPLRHLASVMHAIARGDRAERVKLASSDELRSLGEAFNLMISQLTRANENLRAEIAARERATEALRISEERFRLSIESVKDYAIFTLDPRGYVASWNAGAERIKGYQAAEIIGRHFSIFYSQEDIVAGKPEDALRRAAREGRIEEDAVRVRKDGSHLWADIVMTAVRDESGVLVGFSKVTRDVTERKSMEERLRQSELRFRTMFEHAPIGIALSDGAGLMIQTNPALQDMLGFTEDELSGRPLSAAIRLDEYPTAEQPVIPASGNGKRHTYQGEVTCLTKDGSTAWISLNVSTMPAGHDQSPYSIMMMEDISLRRATEQQIRMLAHTITSMNESVVITDSRNIILSVNPAFCNTYGYSANEIVGTSADLLWHRTATGEMPEKVRSVMRAGGWTGELVATRKQGGDITVLLSTSVVRDHTGTQIAMVSISRDITEQKSLQRKLEEAERERLAGLRRFAVSVQRALEEERARISRELHDDLCQRLSGMKFRVEVLQDQIRPPDRKALRHLRDFAQELDRSITEVRRISSNLRPSVLDDFGLVIALKMLCKEFEALHSIRTNLQIEESAPRHADPSVEIALYRIAQEALSNIARHSGASAVTVQLIPFESSLRLVVEDNGRGFNPGQAAQEKQSGHGLGLISMRERSELLGGSFEIDSASTSGTTISVTMPLGDQTEHEKDADTDR